MQNVQTEMCEFVLKMRCLAVWLDDNHDCKAVDVEEIILNFLTSIHPFASAGGDAVRIRTHIHT